MNIWTKGFMVFAALFPVHFATFPTAMDGDLLWRANYEKWPTVQVLFTYLLCVFNDLSFVHCKGMGWMIFCLMAIVVCPCCRISCKAKGKVQRNPEENINEDEDVMVEKARVREALTCQCCEEVGNCIWIIMCTDKQADNLIKTFVLMCN